MLKTALSASLIAFAVLAPAASAAPAPKPQPVVAPVLDEKAARYCAEIAAVKPDKKGVVTFTKEQLAFLANNVCPRPADCPDAAKQAKYDDAVKQYAQTGSSSRSDEWPEWLEQAYRPECSLDRPAAPAPEQPFDPSVIGSDKLRP